MRGFGKISEDDETLCLKEIAFSADPKEIRKISEFLLYVAEEMEKYDDYGHRHYCDYIDKPKHELDTDIVIAR